MGNLIASIKVSKYKYVVRSVMRYAYLTGMAYFILSHTYY